MDRYINRIIRSPLGRTIRSPETGGYALPEAYDTVKNMVFLLKPLYPREEPSRLFSRFEDETRYIQGLFRDAFNHPSSIQIDSYPVPFEREQKQRTLRMLVEGEGGIDRLITELEVACDDEAPYTQRWEVLGRIIVEGRTGNPLLVERLVQLLPSDMLPLRLLAVEAVGKVGDPLAIPHLFRVLHEDPHPDVRAMAGLALGQLGVREARLPLIQRATQCADVGEQHDLFCAIGLLGGLEQDAPGLNLAARGSSDPAPQLRAVVEACVTEGLEGLAGILYDYAGDRQERLACFSLLEHVKPQYSLPLLLPILDDPDEAVAANATQVAGLHIVGLQEGALRTEALSAFAELLNTSRRARCRAMAASVIGRVGDKSMIEMLDRRGIGDPDMLVRDTAERSRKRLEDRLLGYHRERNDGDIGVWGRVR